MNIKIGFTKISIGAATLPFVSCQENIIIDNEDFKIDLLFYHHVRWPLGAIELRLGSLQRADRSIPEMTGQARTSGREESPIGLILCAEKNQEQIELLELDRGHIRVSEYLTQLPPEEVFASRLHKAIELAQVKKEE